MRLKKTFRNAADSLAGTMKEVAASLRALKAYPLGLVDSRVELTPHQEQMKNPRPIILVHGVVHNHSAFMNLKAKLQDQGWRNIYPLNYGTRHGSFMGMVDEISQIVHHVLAETQASQVDIVAHSLGGVVGRYFMCIGEGRGLVNKLITIGSPHQGTDLGAFLRTLPAGSLVSDLRRQSYLMKTLNQVPLPSGSKVISIYSDADWLLRPLDSCLAQGIPPEAFENYLVKNVGHIGLLFDRQVFEIVTESVLDCGSTVMV